MKLQMSFGENLINLRKQKGWSQDDLADNLNLSRQAISKWENNTSKPDIDNIKKISKIFSVTIDDLLNNDVVKDKAVTLNVKKKEKKERTITIVKCMIIAVIILYIINVIFKFASLLIIVNGIQKYANLSNYHYVITTYDENGLVEQEECWFKDGVSKTNNTIYNNNNIIKQTSECIDFNNKYGYIEDNINNKVNNVDVQEYVKYHIDCDKGKQLFDNFPISIKNREAVNILYKSLSGYMIKIKKEGKNIYLQLENVIIILNKENFLPYAVYTFEKKDNQIINIQYKIEINSVKNIKI